ncbi:MAG: aromatic ring-hydroxylating dioxygenase subunit alpha [Proteobacteria bacterium]|nr:aromatic ring-hydroxylating dioxygenase subunit alpha [Pseudomonadota bacterium]
MDDKRPIRELIACQKPGWSLERRFYTDPEIYKLEIDQIVMRNWIFAGHESQVAESGDFKVLNVASESAIIVRGQDGKIRAFANTCRHRGSLVCLEPSGNTRKFECPYHAWVYDTEGKLIGARDMPADFNKEKFALNPVSIDVVHGLMFICFCDGPPSLDSAKRDLAEPLAMFDFENLKVAATKTYPISANWKLSVENYVECYHCAPAHSVYAKMHTLMLDANKQKRVQGHMLEKMPACGLKVISYDCADINAPPGQQGYTYSRTAMFEGYKSGSRDGEPIAPLLGNLSDYDGGGSDISIGPVSFFLAYSDHVVGYVFTPVDQTHCQCQTYWMVRSDAVEGKDYDCKELMWLWDTTLYADEEIIVNNWKGVQSRYYKPGPLSGMEKSETRFISWVLHELRRAPSITS